MPAAFAEATAFDAAGSAASVLGDKEDNAEANIVYGTKAHADQIVSNVLTWKEFA